MPGFIPACWMVISSRASPARMHCTPTGQRESATTDANRTVSGSPSITAICFKASRKFSPSRARATGSGAVAADWPPIAHPASSIAAALHLHIFIVIVSPGWRNDARSRIPGARRRSAGDHAEAH
jgi:hypothetical protein